MQPDGGHVRSEAAGEVWGVNPWDWFWLVVGSVPASRGMAPLNQRLETAG